MREAPFRRVFPRINPCHTIYMPTPNRLLLVIAVLSLGGCTWV
jgi:hypothetical protein